MNILTINAGSSSIKYKTFVVNQQNQQVILSGLIEGIGESTSQWRHEFNNKTTFDCQFSDHQQAFTELAHRLKQDLINHPIDGIGHRVVHGGRDLFQPTRIDDKVLQDIEKLKNLAPIHNPINAQGIHFARQHFPQAIHVAIFDSGFHHTLPEHINQYAIDTATAKHYQIRRYGFHGINHEYVATQAAHFLQKPLHACHFISLHLGNGASACLIKNGQSFDTTMGMTPLAGLIMGTRCGDIDPAIVLYLLEQGMNLHDVDRLLNKQSGLKGIAQDNDMRNLIERYESQDRNAQLAIDMYVYSIQKTIGAYLSQINPLDALIFTGGVGENSDFIREKILAPLPHLGFYLDNHLNHQKKTIHNIAQKGHPILVIRGDEESLMATNVATLCGF